MRSFTASKPLVVSSQFAHTTSFSTWQSLFFQQPASNLQEGFVLRFNVTQDELPENNFDESNKVRIFFFSTNLNKSEEKMQAFTKNHVLIMTAAANRDENAIFPWKRLGRRNVDLFENYSLFAKKNIVRRFRLINERRHLLNRNCICIILSIWLLLTTTTTM